MNQNVGYKIVGFFEIQMTGGTNIDSVSSITYLEIVSEKLDC